MISASGMAGLSGRAGTKCVTTAWCYLTGALQLTGRLFRREALVRTRFAVAYVKALAGPAAELQDVRASVKLTRIVFAVADASTCEGSPSVAFVLTACPVIITYCW